ncbi:hypothetical protein [Paenibacillus kribbensis]|uniref:hypothetical protein n=1 Tax=Paenibacillus kribbensis TaxID=172713 RepID=UPI000838F85E|nr:hypothetical protein [Paenibacillus kribbensis]
MTDKQRNWQEDMKLCGEGVSPIEFIYESRQALPYWLQQYDIELRGRKRWEEVAKGLQDDLKQAESLIQLKDAEILRMYGVNQILETELFEAKAEIDKLKQSKRFELIRKIREKADTDTYALAEECVRLEGELKTVNLAYEGLQTNCVSRGEYEATLKKLDEMTKAYHALLQDEGDKL